MRFYSGLNVAYLLLIGIDCASSETENEVSIYSKHE